MRALIFELHPDALEKEGLVNALDRHAQLLRTRYKLEVDVDLCEEPHLSLDAKEAMYRIAQEALNNINKHANASKVQIKLEQIDREIILEVLDDGVGFDPQGKHPGHLGLRSMQERADQFGWQLDIRSTDQEGTKIRVYAPKME
jgi:signal transduction histidine kinase